MAQGSAYLIQEWDSNYQKLTTKSDEDTEGLWKRGGSVLDLDISDFKALSAASSFFFIALPSLSRTHELTVHNCHDITRAPRIEAGEFSAANTGTVLPEELVP
jgi:hypothetical protein